MSKEKRLFFRFYGELNDFLEFNYKNRIYFYKGRQTVKDCIESMGVPHPEVFLLLKGKNKVIDFSYLVENEDRISVYPVFHKFDFPEDMLLRTPYRGKPKFILDTHLGKLAKYLRMLGFDTFYRNDYDDKELADISHKKNRILLTRDHGLLKRKMVKYGYFVRFDDPRQQLISVLNRYQLYKKIDSLGRCLECNTPLHTVKKENIIHKLEPKTKKYFNKFYECPRCNKIYWKGSHFKEMKKFIGKLKSNNKK